MYIIILKMHYYGLFLLYPIPQKFLMRQNIVVRFRGNSGADQTDHNIFGVIAIMRSFYAMWALLYF